MGSPICSVRRWASCSIRAKFRARNDAAFVVNDWRTLAPCSPANFALWATSTSDQIPLSLPRSSNPSQYDDLADCARDNDHRISSKHQPSPRAAAETKAVSMPAPPAVWMFTRSSRTATAMSNSLRKAEALARTLRAGVTNARQDAVTTPRQTPPGPRATILTLTTAAQIKERLPVAADNAIALRARSVELVPVMA